MMVDQSSKLAFYCMNEPTRGKKKHKHITHFKTKHVYYQLEAFILKLNICIVQLKGLSIFNQKVINV